MNLISDLFRGMIFLSILATTQHGCTVKEVARKAADAHKKGLTEYGQYSRSLTKNQDSWIKK